MSTVMATKKKQKKNKKCFKTAKKHTANKMFLTSLAVCPPLENQMYLAEFWTFAYTQEAKFGHIEHFLRT